MKKERVNLNVFVYGTLRIGEHNFKRHFLEHSPDAIHENAYVKNYFLAGIMPITHSRLYICPKGMVPYAMKTNVTTKVKGNLFQFLDRDRQELKKLLSSMDNFEGHPRFYKRRFENVFYTDDSDSVDYKHCKAYMYEYIRNNYYNLA